MLDLTVPEIKRRLQNADSATFAVLERSLAADTRKGVRQALEVARRRLAAEQAERDRVRRLFTYEHEIAHDHGASVIVGLDEVGRGCLAGPVAVGAVVLDENVLIDGLNDSKQIKPDRRQEIAAQIRQCAQAVSTWFIDPADIDAEGMIACLRRAFRSAVAEIEQAGVIPDIILLDGNPLHMDKREVNVIKGDAKCASVAAASIVAKVARDEFMESLADDYPAYNFASNKGYASADHIAAIKEHGLTPIHRVSFCTGFAQPSLFENEL